MRLVLATVMLSLAALAAWHAPAPAPLAGDHDRAIQFPDVPGATTCVVDLHTHSVFSDGEVWPTIRVKEARKDGVDLLAVTEHLEYQPHRADIPHSDRNRSYAVASGSAGDDVLVVNGAEITKDMPPGHVNAVFLDDANTLLHEAPKLSREESAERAYAAAAEQGAFVFWNHPSWVGQRSDGVARLEDQHRSLIERGLLHGVEVANGDMYSAEAFAMALEHDLAVLGTSDIHGLIDWDYDLAAGDHRTVTLVFAEERTPESIRAALHAGRTVAWMHGSALGREEHLRPLVEASLSVARAGPRRDKQLIDVTLRNDSDANWQLANRGGHNFYEQPGVILVPPHGEITLGVAGETRREFSLEFEVLNALIGPETPLPVALRVTLD